MTDEQHPPPPTADQVREALKCPMVQIAGCIHDRHWYAHPKVVEAAAREWLREHDEG